MQKETIAVYFDGDNVSHKRFGDILAEIRSYGDIIINRVYADFEALGPIENSAIENGISTIQCARLIGKNSSDIKLCVDLMRDLYTLPQITTFYIITSDTDYRHIIPEIKLLNKQARVIGKAVAPEILKACCDQYTPIEVIPKNKN